MFTGIIIGVGKIGAVRHGAQGLSMDVDTAGAVPDPVIGESVALNGVCLTVTAARGALLTFDVSAETLRRTTFSGAAPGREVNIERALRLGDRLGGHLVQGHVDGVGTVAAVTPAGEGYELEIELPPDGVRYSVEKGSIAVDGVSLTVARKTGANIAIAIIPHTWANTTLRTARPGTAVNIEYDMMAKYVENFTRPLISGGGVSEELLRRAGFLPGEEPRS